MALSLRRIFQETRHRYHLELVCGEEGLDNIMSWVYISEDIHTSDFLQGGELIITTGVSGHQSSSWLSRLICTLIAHNTCGLILNIGPYIKREDISDEILSLCKQANFPLFVMPWNIRIADITSIITRGSSATHRRKLRLRMPFRNCFFAAMRNTDWLSFSQTAFRIR